MKFVLADVMESKMNEKYVDRYKKAAKQLADLRMLTISFFWPFQRPMGCLQMGGWMGW